MNYRKSIKRLLVTFALFIIMLCPQYLWAQHDVVINSNQGEKSVLLKQKENTGFRLVAESDGRPFLLAFSDSEFFLPDSIPPHIQSWVDGYSEILELNHVNPEWVTEWLNASFTGAADVVPLLSQTEWGQDAPYNNYCPIIDGKRCPSGCVATALAQIMRFYQWPKTGTGGVKSYQTKTHQIPMQLDYDTVKIDWDNIYDEYGTDVINDQPIASLLQAVGIAVEMDYAPGGSGSNDRNVLRGIPEYLGYDKDMYFAEPDAYTDEQWHRLLQTELQEGHPVYYTGGSIASGHAFVIDGMQTREDNGLTYYHINWGWNGLCNGYYLLNMLRPSEAGTGGTSGVNYGLHPSMLIGLKPDDGIREEPYMLCKSIDIYDNDYYAGQNLSLKISRLVLRSEMDFTGSLQVIMHSLDNPDDARITSLYTEKKRSITRERGLTNYYIPVSLSNNQPPGNYQIELLCVTTDGDTVNINTDQWPHICVLPDSQFPGGEEMQPRQYVGARSTLFMPTGEGNFVMQTDSLKSATMSGATGKLSLVLYDSLGHQLCRIGKPVDIQCQSRNIIQHVTLNGELSRYMANGHYYLGLGFLPNGTSKWTYIYELYKEGENYYIGSTPLLMPLSVENGLYRIGGFEFLGADNPLPTSLKAPAICLGLPNGVYDLFGRWLGHSINNGMHNGCYIVVENGNLKKMIVQK